MTRYPINNVRCLRKKALEMIWRSGWIRAARRSSEGFSYLGDSAIEAVYGEPKPFALSSRSPSLFLK